MMNAPLPMLRNRSIARPTLMKTGNILGSFERTTPMVGRFRHISARVRPGETTAHGAAFMRLGLMHQTSHTRIRVDRSDATGITKTTGPTILKSSATRWPVRPQSNLMYPLAILGSYLLLGLLSVSF